MRKVLALAACCAAGLLLSTVRSGAASAPGSELYIRKGCLGCHGASGYGGVGPTLAHTALPVDSLVRQLRHPRGIMPAFPPQVVSDDEARAIHGYLQTLAPPPARLRADLPHGTLDPSTCSPCHARVTPVIVQQFESSAMGKPGTQNPMVVYPIRQITCANCHGTDHDQIMASGGRVPEVTCGGCHGQIYNEHVQDAGHSYGPGPGKMGINWDRNIGVPHYKEMPRKVMEMGCDVCHSQAGATDDRYWSARDRKYVDTSSLPYRNGCVACHTRHAFSLEEARKPEACYTCHMGPDHPNFEAYMSSKHGSIYAARGAKWDWTVPLAQARYETPTCAYCHMLYVDSTGARHTRHSMTRKIIWGMGVQAATGQLKDLVVEPGNAEKRNEMVRVCMTCHSEDRAREYLRSADAHKLAGDALVVEARDILAGLYHDQLIRPSHAQVSAGLLQGPRFTAIELPGTEAQHSPTSLYYDVTPVEREYFDMFFFSALKSYKGAFHMSPDYAWWYGYADVLGHLAAIRSDAERLRSERAVERRTAFMLWTGPLMVLLVLGGVFGVRRWTRRPG
ncbi:MAG TPA: multiheme c-type cytochrome [Candidatus Saccharimonadales bacterium]|nr:multiheme c-type cytochrome [Candidatus Saccharimonadales bacterium]